MKVLKRVIFVVILVLLFVGLLLLGKGYNIYKDAIKKVPLSEKIESIKKKDNYTKINEVPQMYINAVI